MPMFEELSGLPLTAPKISKTPSSTKVKPVKQETSSSLRESKKDVGKSSVPPKSVPDKAKGKKPLNIPDLRKKIQQLTKE